MDNSATIERVKNELKQVKTQMREKQLNENIIKVDPTRKDQTVNFYVWDVVIKGRPGTDWEGGIYKGQLKFGDTYPQTAPSFYFAKVVLGGKEQAFQHINVYQDGRVCVDILTGNVYNPSKNIAEVLDYIEKLLYTPNPKSAANGDLADLQKSNSVAYSKRIKEQAQACK